MRLSDLRVVISPFPMRPATVADLVDALRDAGAEVVDVKPPNPLDIRGPVSGQILCAPGRYLVYGPIPVEVENER